MQEMNNFPVVFLNEFLLDYVSGHTQLAKNHNPTTMQCNPMQAMPPFFWGVSACSDCQHLTSSTNRSPWLFLSGKPQGGRGRMHTHHSLARGEAAQEGQAGGDADVLRPQEVHQAVRGRGAGPWLQGTPSPDPQEADGQEELPALKWRTLRCGPPLQCRQLLLAVRFLGNGWR